MAAGVTEVIVEKDQDETPEITENNTKKPEQVKKSLANGSSKNKK